VQFSAHIRRALEHLEEASLLRSPREVDGPQGPELVIAGRRVLSFCSNNYLGFAGDPRITAAAISALDVHGLGAAASRHISGTHTFHREAEACLAHFVRLPSALLFSTGYAANLGTVQALLGPGDAIFSDELNHASLIDGARLSRAQVYVFRHGDPEHLALLLNAHRAAHETALVVTESLFSMDGDRADLQALRSLADQHRCGFMVDEAHALGVFGPQGRGLCAHQGVVPDAMVGTLGKAFGCSGAFVAGTRELVQLIENRARSYIFSTAPPPALAAAAIAAEQLVRAADDRRTQLLSHCQRLRTGLLDLGYRVLAAQGPILPLLIGPPEATMALSAALLERGVFVHGVRPPTVPPGSCRLRVTAMATHSDAQIATALAAFQACRNLL
jgi:8-amino-7-oxononanoate synthase